VTADVRDGTFAMRTADGIEVSGLNRYVDGGDAGDTYNWSPPRADTLVDRPASVEVEVVERGPVRARLVITAEYEWPAELDGGRRSRRLVPVEVRTTVDVVDGEPFARVRTSFRNTARDHRLRVHFPLPAAVAESQAESAFAVVRRGLRHKGNPIEAGLPTYPSARFVDCSNGAVGLTVFHEGVGEYEVVDFGASLALTVMRAVGFLSRDTGSLRPVAAGPSTPLEGAQLQGPFTRSYALLLHRGDWQAADPYARADDALLPLDWAWGSPGGPRPAWGGDLAVRGGHVTAVTRSDGRLVVRVLRASDEAGTVEVDWRGRPAAGSVVDLRGRPAAAFAGSIDAPAWSITTIEVAE
jgi:mannosylglycerate hydrolase